MKDREDKTRGIVSLIGEDLTKNKPTETWRLGKQTTRRKRNWSDSSGNSPTKSLNSCKKTKHRKSSYKRPEVFTATVMNTIGSDPVIRYFLPDRFSNHGVVSLEDIVSLSFPLSRYTELHVHNGHVSSWHPDSVESVGEEEDWGVSLEEIVSVSFPLSRYTKLRP